jgi:hypothetical protein
MVAWESGKERGVGVTKEQTTDNGCSEEKGSWRLALPVIFWKSGVQYIIRKTAPTVLLSGCVDLPVTAGGPCEMSPVPDLFLA